MPTWDDAQYLKFADERTRAARELLARVPLRDAAHVVDLGCGPGNSTALLRERWPAAQLTGVDSSPEMLERARRDQPDIEWALGDARTYMAASPLDVLFANAVLHWVPEHARVFPRLLRQLRGGGVLALQMPNNFAEPSHRLMRELPGPWSARLGAIHTRAPVGTPAFYYDVLAPHARAVDIWQTTYEHVMPNAAAIVEWVKGTGLRPYLEQLSPEERSPFLEAYTRAIDAAYPPRAGGARLFSFPRLFIVVVR